LIVIVGPTGVGKSNLAIRLAGQFNGEIVNGDSRQIYCYMDIGTAKPDPVELNAVPHHLFNIVEPDHEYNLAQYQSEANLTIQSILKRQKQPILVGGSGQYILGLLEGWQVPRVPPDIELRINLERKAAENSGELYQELEKLDPQAAQNIDKRNIRRVIRALEVCLQSGGQFSQMRTKAPPDYHILWIGLTMNREELYRHTDARVVEMFKQGLVNETEKLLNMGYKQNIPSMSSIGYKQAAQLLKKELTEKEAVTKVQTETHRYIRHQYAWFRLKDPRIKWFDNGKDVWPEIKHTVAEFLL
jgi:tRNA dimethylallyltransferase